MACALRSTLRYFNPRSPCGERPQYIALIVFCCQYADQRRAIGPRKTSCKDLKEAECGANLPRDAWEPHARTADYSAKKPSASYVGFAPTCSIFVWYLLPR